MVPIVRPQPQTILQLDAVSSMLGPGVLRPAGAREKSGIDLPICGIVIGLFYERKIDELFQKDR